jgi:hypothetical protein
MTDIDEMIREENSPLVLEMSENGLQAIAATSAPPRRDFLTRNPLSSSEFRGSQCDENPFFEPPSRIPRSLVRILLVCFSSMVSTLVPDVGLLVSLAGASSGAALALIFPPLLYLTLHQNKKEKIAVSELTIHILSIVVGLTAAVLGTAVSLLEIVRTLNRAV